MKIVVLMGGLSEERDVSLATGVEVAGALREAGHEVVPFDTARGPLEEDEEEAVRESGVQRIPPPRPGRDILETGDASALVQHPRTEDADLFFLALHGGAGENGTIQAFLDVIGRPYTGSGLLGCALAMDKDVSKRLFRDADISTAPWLTGERDAEEVAEALGLPVIVKAAGGGSSLRLIVAHDMAELKDAVEESRSFDDLVVYEAFVTGREVTVGVLGDEALPVGEIIPEHEIFDYECKYQPGMAQEIFPADLPAETVRYLQKLALRAHRVLRLEHYSRVDFMLDDRGEAWCLEANALPGMTSNSLIPKAARAAGISFPELCDTIARLAVGERNLARGQRV